MSFLPEEEWNWIGHVLRREDGNIAKTAMRWTPEKKRKRGRPRPTWRRKVEGELRELGMNRGQAALKAI